MENAKSQDGFTLIELLVVIVVLGILAGVVILGITNINQAAWVSDCQSDGANVNIAIQNFRTENASYPTSIQQLLQPNPSTGSPFIGSWPANNSHYSFALSPAFDGSFILSTPKNQTGVTWSGTADCTNPSLQLQ